MPFARLTHPSFRAVQLRACSASSPPAPSSCCSTAWCTAPETSTSTHSWTRCAARCAAPCSRCACTAVHALRCATLHRARTSPTCYLSAACSARACDAIHPTNPCTKPQPQVRLYDALRSAGLPPAQLREAMLLRSTAVGNNEPPRLRLPTDQFVLWVRRHWLRCRHLRFQLAAWLGVDRQSLFGSWPPCVSLQREPHLLALRLTVRWRCLSCAAGERPGTGRAVRQLAARAADPTHAHVSGWVVGVRG